MLDKATLKTKKENFIIFKNKFLARNFGERYNPQE